MADQAPPLSLARRLLRRIPGARPLVHRLVAMRDAATLRKRQAGQAEADQRFRQTPAEVAALRVTLEATERERQAALERSHALTEETQALRTALHATEREREAALERANLQATLGRDLMRGIDGLSVGLASEIHAARDRLALEVKSVEAQVLASRSWLDGQIRDIARPHSSAGGKAATLYLDLLERSLTGVLDGDLSVDPWTAGSYDPARRAIGRDWPATACTMIGTARMRNLRHLLERALAEDVPGDFIETGVWRGGACIYARGIMAAHGDTTRRVFVADSFRGLPEPDGEAFPADAGDQHSTYDQLAISQQQVAENFRRYGLLDDRVVFLEGWFKDTLPAAPIERLAVLRLDGDMYESTIQALDALYDKVSPGGYVIVDDYVLGPCARAIEDFRAARGITAAMEPVDGAAVWWQVPR